MYRHIEQMNHALLVPPSVRVHVGGPLGAIYVFISHFCNGQLTKNSDFVIIFKGYSKDASTTDALLSKRRYLPERLLPLINVAQHVSDLVIQDVSDMHFFLPYTQLSSVAHHVTDFCGCVAFEPRPIMPRSNVFQITVYNKNII